MTVNRCERHTITIIWQDHNKTVSIINSMGSSHFIYLTRCCLFFNTSLFNKIDKNSTTAITYRRFWRIHFNITVINIHSTERGHHMLYSEYLCLTIFQCGSAHSVRHIINVCSHRRIPFNVRADKHNSCIFRCRFENHMYWFTAMKANPLI